MRQRVRELTRQSRTRNPARDLQDLRVEARRYQSATAYDKAEATLREAVELCKKNGGEKNPQYARSLLDLAFFLTKTRAFDRAEPVYREALEVFKTIEGEGGQGYSNTLYIIGHHYQQKGDRVREREYYRQYIQAIKAATADPNGPWASRPDRTFSYQYMLMMTGMETEVEPVLHQCLTIEEQLLEDGLVVQSERERLRTNPRSLLAEYLNVAMTCEPVPAEHIYQHILAYKGAALRLSENRLVRDRPELKELIDKLAAARERLARLTYSPPSAGQPDDWSRHAPAPGRRSNSWRVSWPSGVSRFAGNWNGGTCRRPMWPESFPRVWYSSTTSNSRNCGPRTTDSIRGSL